jgi:hypothetical protein
LGAFASKALATEAMNGETPSSSSVERAVRCYLNESDSAKPGWFFPAFLRGREPVNAVQLSLELERGLWKSLREEAEAQEVSVEQMLEHAVLYFAAEVNAGRITQRILDRD